MISRSTIREILGIIILSASLATIPLCASRAEAIFEVAASGDIIFAGGTGQLYVSQNNGLTWAIFDTADGLGKGTISAIALTDTAVWVATYYDTILVGTNVFVNGGLFKSNPHHIAWQSITIPFRIEAGNIPYDIAIDGTTIWTANWWRSLHRSTDGGATWEMVIPDTSTYYNPWQRFNQRILSIAAENPTIWTGSEDGLNLSTNNGVTWRQIKRTGGTTDISGNRVVAVSTRQTAQVNEVWAATWTTYQTGEKNGVSISADTGRTWRIVLDGQRAWDFLFHDSDIFVAGKSGLWRSRGAASDFVNITAGILPPGTEVYSVAMTADSTIWIGTGDGLYSGNYAGSFWEKVDLLTLDADDGTVPLPLEISLGTNYPNPFNPETKIEFTLPRALTVRIDIINLLGQSVRTLVNEHMTAGDHVATWNGTDNFGNTVATGVYFYRLTAGDVIKTKKMVFLK